MSTDTKVVIKTDKKIGEKGTRTSTKISDRNRDLVESFIGRDVMVVLKGENKLKGRLEAVSIYELMLTISQKPVLVMKHAIDYVEMVDTTQQK